MNTIMLILTLPFLAVSKKKISQEDIKDTLDIIEYAYSILPAPAEYYQSTIFLYDEDMKNNKINTKNKSKRFKIFNKNTNLILTFEFASSNKRKKPQDVFSMLPSFPSAESMPERTYSKRNIADHSWYHESYDPEINGIGAASMWFSDGSIGIWCSLFRSPKEYTPGKFVFTTPLTPDEIRFAEDIIIKMLARMTVLGLTSKPKESAPEWAKRQVAERLAGRKL
jgi:hypothetical protein